MAIISKLYEELSRFNTFSVNGRTCENGAFSALISDKPYKWYENIMFQYGFNGIVTLTDGLPRLLGGRAWDINGYFTDIQKDYTEFTILWTNGQRGTVIAYNRELPNPVQTSNLLDTRLIDDRHIWTRTDGSVCVAFDINRVPARTKEHDDILGYIRRNIPFNLMQITKTIDTRLSPCVIITDKKAILGFADLDGHMTVPTFGKEVDASSIMDYVRKVGKQ